MIGARAIADLGSSGERPGTILEVYVGDFGVPGATWVKFLPDDPIHYGCSVDVMRRELKPMVDFNSRAWHRAIAATTDVTLILLDDGEAFDGLPRVHWIMPVGKALVECHAEPLPVGRSGNVRVQVKRPNDILPFYAPHVSLYGPTHDRAGRPLRLPTSEIQVAANPAAAWSHLCREAKILAFGGVVLAALTGCAAGSHELTLDARGLDATADIAGDAPIDASVDVSVDVGGLGLEADCDPTIDECTAGLTCRPDGKLRGHCRPVGTLPAGAPCQTESDCGYAMTWFSDQAGVARCAVICDTEAPQQRCKPNQPCWSIVGRLGICAP